MIKVSEIFKIGIGPSSSHTVGPMVAAGAFLEEIHTKLMDVACVQVELYGSLAATGKGHATDTAILLGLLGHKPKTIDSSKTTEYLTPIFQEKTLLLAGVNRIDFDVDTHIIWHMDTSLSYHPNAMSLTAYFKDGSQFSQTYYSIGGGFIQSAADVHPAQESTENTPPPDAPKTSTAPYPFYTAQALLDLTKTHKLSISELMLANECHDQAKSDIERYLDDIWDVMQSCVRQGCKNDGILPGGLQVKRRAKALYDSLSTEYEQAGHKDGGLLAMEWVNLYALAVNEENANGGKVVTAPTNGAAGIVPAVLHYYRDFIDTYSIEGVRRFLLTAAAIGALIKENASISGAEVGCQGEVGSACAMAAAGLAEVLGATPAQVLNAAEIGLEHNLGLTCDPIAGLVQVPCIERNAMASMKAINAARLALRGDGQHHVSLDEAILTMKQTGADMMDKYKETARGGLAIYVGGEKTHKKIPTVNFSQC
ncbi:MAG: L-serine ammonia-lyase [Moraxella sp.]|nr:L-serine ammonia-lyase [Moraxella sp.]